MRMYDEINTFKKEFVYEQYTRIVENFKDYEKITKIKMLDAIYNVYDNPDNIVDICTARELKYLKMVLNNNFPCESMEDIISKEFFYKKDKYDWEITTLRNKFLLDYNRHIPEEIISKVKISLKRVDLYSKMKVELF